MHAFVTTTPGGPLEDESADTPVPAGTEVLLRTLAAGVCHSDVHLQEAQFDLGNGKRLEAGGPGLTLGHEIAGTVIAAGPDANGVSAGDAYVVFPWIGCGDCARCADGDEHLCDDGRVLGFGRPGGYADHVLVPHPRYLLPIGELPPALACTFACSGLTALSALKKAGTLATGDLPAGSTANSLVIVGAGGVGLNAVHLAPLVTGTRPIVVDISDEKLALARNAGALDTVDAREADAAKKLRSLTRGGAAVAIDFVGSESSSALAQRSLRKGGKLIVVGLFGGTFSMPLPMIPLLARTIQGSYVGSLAEMRELMALAHAGRIPALPLSLRDASAAAATAALDDLRHGRAGGRIVLTF